MATQLTVLNDLPRFKGNARSGDKPSPPGINVKTFLRTLENYFTQHNITENAKKIQLLFALIDKENGDAIDLVTCYAGKEVDYEDICHDFILMYPNFTTSEFRHAARAVLNSKIEYPTLFCGMTRMENQSRAVVEAYLNGNENNRVGVSPSTTLNDDDDENDGHLALIDVLQNFLMHLITSTQLQSNVYDKIAPITAADASTRFMSRAVEAAERQKMSDGNRYPRKRDNNSNDVIWEVREQAERQNERKPRYKPTERSAKPRPYNTKNRDTCCLKCGESTHISRECKATKLYCSFCKIKGHVVKICQKRLAQAAGKHCKNCRISNSHNTEECYALKKGRERYDVSNNNNKVRMISTQETEEIHFENPETEYTSDHAATDSETEQ